MTGTPFQIPSDSHMGLHPDRFSRNSLCCNEDEFSEFVTNMDRHGLPVLQDDRWPSFLEVQISSGHVDALDSIVGLIIDDVMVRSSFSDQTGR